MFRLPAAAAILALTAVSASAGVIVSPTAVFSNTGGNDTPQTSVGNTIDRSGLFTPFTSGSTDFDTYIASNPFHSNTHTNFEWHTPAATPNAVVIYDLGSSQDISRMAFWNEDEFGTGTVMVETSATSGFGVSTTVLAATAVTDTAFGFAYLPQVFSLTASTGRYVRLTLTHAGGNRISVGEVAFEIASVVPEPGTIGLFGAGALGLLGLVIRRRRAAKSAAPAA